MLNQTFLKSYAKIVNHNEELQPHAVGRSWFKVNEIASLYNIPLPSSSQVVVGVISFGGGLVGQVDQNGLLTNGDVQSYWTYLGIAPENMPRVLVVPILGATNNPGATDGSTEENTLDVETIGGCCPTSNLTIILYIAPNSLSTFNSVFTYALNTPVVYNSQNLLPTILSVSWGAPEIFFNNLSSVDATFKQATLRGINICVASGDNGSSDGLRGNNVDFPSSSPNVIAVGGTRLVSVLNTYSNATTETAWTGSGGGFSRTFLKPTYQSGISGTYRASPDVSLDADPNTGVIFFVNGQYVIYGGTSVSAPTMAGYLACINPTSFINPRLYSASSSCFHDIVSGSNGAYSGRTGYDNCTGLGSIVGGQLQNVLKAQIAVTGLTISPATIAMSAGTTQQAIVTFLPITATPSSVTWTTSNAGVASVNSNGNILGVGNGSAQIRATSTVNASIFANVTVLVSTRVTGVTLDVSTLALNLRTLRFYQLTATVSPSSASVKTVTWTSTRPSVATISSAGLLTARAVGTTSIQVTTTDGTFRAVCVVTVTA
jgi:kumamolisin